LLKCCVKMGCPVRIVISLDRLISCIGTRKNGSRSQSWMWGKSLIYIGGPAYGTTAEASCIFPGNAHGYFPKSFKYSRIRQLQKRNTLTNCCVLFCNERLETVRSFSGIRPVVLFTFQFRPIYEICPKIVPVRPSLRLNSGRSSGVLSRRSIFCVSLH
jgi:hypothetical protein